MNFKLVMGVLVGLAAAQFFPGASRAQDKQDKPTKKLELKTLSEKAAYAIGMSSGASIRRVNENQSLQLDPDLILRGFRDAFGNGKPAIPEEEMEESMQKLQENVAERNAKAGEAFLAANKAKPGVKTLASGLQIKVLKKGTGKRPNDLDTVVVHYRGKTVDGKEFESSYALDQPATLPVNAVIPGWSEALKLMEVGTKAEIYIPAELAYGPQPQEKFGPNSTLVFELELVDIAKANPQLPLPGQSAPRASRPAKGRPEEISN